MRRGSLLLILVLGGCDGEAQTDDLRLFMDEVRMRPGPAVAALPAFAAYEGFTYTASTRRDPFQRAADNGHEPGGWVFRPDARRAGNPLEGFDITAFSMVGSLSAKAGRYGLIKADGAVHRVGLGDYLGRDHGRVVAIEEGAIELVEILADGAGGWQQRTRRLLLAVRP
ncbi:pilus assembly protein PilP [Stutzerimonas kirkiae]|uniref:Pilus assembly protein PilP n=1 Tax=Stutzerimonas kirkiae TaxID=2211392 RepID=A0A4V2KC72_9GAMM|nr:pilus assembly protein PilP [Stutzerimonas kirkiae]TBU92162.1 pilus assembly protein PilP [Stutzerimonas kirkiae]TBU99532.1 pilus assembly protein PilP [Stutzerimonas kirkiae]TBV10445.1 pilus assembly protein PilP [Stutzerimonas kirkiae]TBV13999.1 pilus assembly protein PilP [Stutzerimonas kirkiae]